MSVNTNQISHWNSIFKNKMDSCSLVLNLIENMWKHKEVLGVKTYKDTKSLKEGVYDR